MTSVFLPGLEFETTGSPEWKVQSRNVWGHLASINIKGPDNPTCVFFRKSVAVDTSGSLSKGTSECASVSQ